MVSDDQRVDDCGPSCDVESIWYHTIRVHHYSIIMQARHDDFLPDY